MKRLAVQDANVLIDFWDIGLLEVMYKLNLELHTTDFVFYEIEREDQQEALVALIEQGRLVMHRFSPVELAELVAFQSAQGALSLPDCSVWRLAKQLKAILLTSDGPLRKKATADGLEVHGSLWLLDELLAQQVLDTTQACAALHSLMAKNDRLPKKACLERVKRWCV
jgi:predicted nucleic acid-binding protein